MSESIKPIVAISSCLSCPADSQSTFINQELSKFVEFIPVCPVDCDGELANVQAAMHNGQLVLSMNNEDITQKVMMGAQRILAGLEEVDGFILKHGSAVCGLADVQVSADSEKAQTFQFSGLFAIGVRQKFNSFPIQDEKALLLAEEWEFFLTAIFTFARFRMAKQEGSIQSLISFHRRHKYLLLALNEKYYRNCGPIVANHNRQSAKLLYQNYEKELHFILSQKPRRPAVINSLQHIFGYFSKTLSSKEKRVMLHLFEKYRAYEIPLSSINDLLWRYVLQFDQHYLKQQVFFQPFPKALRRKEWQVLTQKNES